MLQRQVGPAVECPHCECHMSLADFSRWPGECTARNATCQACGASVSLTHVRAEAAIDPSDSPSRAPTG